MKVTIDDQVFAMHRRGGISKYFTHLLLEFTRMPDLNATTPYRYVVNQHLGEAFPQRYQVLPKPGRVPVWPVIDQLNRRGRRLERDVDLVHHTYYRASRLKDHPGARRVCTVHDMIPELFPDMFPLGNPHRDKRRFTEECDAILCVSENTKRDLLTIYGRLDKPVIVTHLGVDGRFFARQSGPPPTRTPYFLFVGARKGYKNFKLLGQALSLLANDLVDVNVVCIGGGEFTRSEIGLLRELGIASRVHQFSPSDPELATFYGHATALCFPSRYEGFGLPLVEAFASGCPVVIANTPCLVEISGGAASVVDPGNPDELADSLLRVLQDSSHRKSLAVDGRQRARDFTWEATAKKTVSAYRTVLGES